MLALPEDQQVAAAQALGRQGQQLHPVAVAEQRQHAGPGDLEPDMARPLQAGLSQLRQLRRLVGPARRRRRVGSHRQGRADSKGRQTRKRPPSGVVSGVVRVAAVADGPGVAVGSGATGVLVVGGASTRGRRRAGSPKTV